MVCTFSSFPWIKPASQWIKLHLILLIPPIFFAIPILRLSRLRPYMSKKEPSKKGSVKGKKAPTTQASSSKKDAEKALLHHPSSANSGKEVIVVVMGVTGTGKTQFINLASGSTLRVGSGLNSCTSDIQIAKPFKLNGYSVTLIDTPGFDDTDKSDVEILKLISEKLSDLYREGPPLAGVIYMHRISDVRFSGGAGKTVKMFHQLCGDKALPNVRIVTNMWGKVSKAEGEARQAELAKVFFKPLLAGGAKLLPHLNTRESAHSILTNMLSDRPEPLQIQVEMVKQKMKFSQTAAGKELNRELEEAARKHSKEMEDLKAGIKAAKKDEQTLRELEGELKSLHVQMGKVKADKKKLTSKEARRASEGRGKFCGLF
ncbi:P-loop containing nucleoside triphosphate hydrolase protein [Flagelloscypha sp. PMI_526]|nr:P-loop containing nucleoside triphosphate hydrolase protein [Flagelloscypha sp. PMI_526]